MSFPNDMSLLVRSASRIINEVNGVNRALYDVTSNPHDRVGVTAGAGLIEISASVCGSEGGELEDRSACGVKIAMKCEALWERTSYENRVL
jgi:hypothetical protein